MTPPVRRQRRQAEGDPDPSVFYTRLNPPGIRVGTAISLLVRKEHHDDATIDVRYRDFWGHTKREQPTAAIASPDTAPDYEQLLPDERNCYRLQP